MNTFTDNAFRHLYFVLPFSWWVDHLTITFSLLTC